MSNRKEILVYANFDGKLVHSLMGRLTATSVKGKEVFGFEYEKSFLQSGFNSFLDPDLQFYSGRYFPRD